MKQLPTQEKLKALFEYKDGSLIWKAEALPPNLVARWANRAAHNNNGFGYIRVTIKGQRFLLHRLMWVWHYGDIPPNLEIDHIDGNRRNNQIENLRLVTRSQNSRNAARRTDNKSGRCGVHWNKESKRWQSLIQDTNKQQVFLGTYDTFKEAVAAREKAEHIYGYTERHGV